MTTIKKLTLKLKSGVLTDLQSDTIFGHFAWRFKEFHGEEKLIEFLKFFKNGNPIFTISDGLLQNKDDIFFPYPLKQTPYKANCKNKKERLKSFLARKEAKSVKYISLQSLNAFLQGNIAKYEGTNFLAKVETPQYKHDLRVNVGIDRNTFTSSDGKLFTINAKYLDEKFRSVLFIKILDEQRFSEFKCEDILISVFEIGYGKKKSSGFGQFEVIGSIEEYNEFQEPDESDGFLSLSHYLPSNDDSIEDAHYEINVKYGKLGEESALSANPFKKPLLLMRPGSCFITNYKKEFYGRAADRISDYKPNIVHNGIAFTLRCKFTV
ncbi:MAG: hypothetical protein JEY94_12205 [Melioribacteraceae bacterium]|nr:hypothetical protein [Melioribacteraceae bacterium]